MFLQVEHNPLLIWPWLRYVSIRPLAHSVISPPFYLKSLSRAKTMARSSITETMSAHPRTASARAATSVNIDVDKPTAATTLETFKDHQSHVLPHKKLMIVFPAIALAQMISYMDQTSVSTALPAIGSSLNLGPSISWVAASFLLASTSVQLINGRLSDIFGRKPLLLGCMGLLAVGNLVAGFSTSPGMLFAFRALSGLGGGAM